jgi:hypothetical protein
MSKEVEKDPPTDIVCDTHPTRQVKFIDAENLYYCLECLQVMQIIPGAVGVGAASADGGQAAGLKELKREDLEKECLEIVNRLNVKIIKL